MSTENLKNINWKSIELALLLSLAVTLLWGAWSLSQQDAIERKMIRLHVVANSDSEEDQALKLQVRDRVLAEATALLAQAEDRTAAQSLLQESLPALEQTAEQTLASLGCAEDVTAELEQTEFPTKDYDSFSLPAGKYTALRVVIGSGAGHNWWCVVYPPLCTTAASDWEETAITAGLDQEDVGLMSETGGYQLKFRSVELWEELRQWFSGI
jgi:stage II sporulation protein R